MKKLFLSFAILFAASTVLVSCGDDASKDASKEAKDGGSFDAAAMSSSKKIKHRKEGYYPKHGTTAVRR